MTYHFRKHRKKIILLSMLLVGYYFLLPDPLFREPTSTVLRSKEGRLLGAKIADDGQWRFPEIEKVPEKFEHCILQFEDAYFHWHWGFNPVSIVKAFGQNISKGTRRGASTITQQVIRLARKRKERTYWEKFKETVLATRLEFRHPKAKILALYASHAPFGGNTVGLEAAAWRYFGKLSQNLSWAENATLAVLPNAPGLIYPGRNQEALRKKRDKLLLKLRKNAIIDTLTYQAAIAEPLPQKPYPLPTIAPHLLEHVAQKHQGERFTSTIDYHLQTQVNSIVQRHYIRLKKNQIHNISVLVMNVSDRKVLAYIGNTQSGEQHHEDVNIIHRPRSTGSILKPFLYAGMLDAGELLPQMLIADVPMQIGSYIPENFVPEYDGAVPADEALARSLNIPSLKMLQQFGLERFHHLLQQMGFENLQYEPSHYGLSLVLGGAEANLWDLCKNYAGFASILRHYNETGKYYTREFVSPILQENDSADFGREVLQANSFSAGAVYLTLHAMKELKRPDENYFWRNFSSSRAISWKTGTSFGFRDAWAVGLNRDILVGVWVGNADGEGRAGLVGVRAAAPVLLQIFDMFRRSRGFTFPADDMSPVLTCRQSGYKAMPDICLDIDTVFAQWNGANAPLCPYHKRIHLDSSGQFRVTATCEPSENRIHTSWFVLPPIMEYYYRQRNAFYRRLPPFREDCAGETPPPMDFIYPRRNVRITLTKDFDSTAHSIIISVAHADPDGKIFWYVNRHFVGITETIHQIPLQGKVGEYHITALDDRGNAIRRKIRLINP